MPHKLVRDLQVGDSLSSTRPARRSALSGSIRMVLAACGLAWAGSVGAELIDDWRDGGNDTVRAQRPPTGSFPNPAFNVFVDTGTSNFLGNDREQYVEITNTGTGSATVNINNGNFSLNLDLGVTGRARFIWDGDADTVNTLNNTYAGDVDVDGLGVDFTAFTCDGAVSPDAIRFRASQSSKGVVIVSLTIWETNGDNHTISFNRPLNTPAGILSFPFATYTSNGVNMASVGAVRLQLEAQGADEDVGLTPVSTCPNDFGDASGFNTFGEFPDDFNLLVDPRARANGPFHALRGPRLGALRDAEADSAFTAATAGVGVANRDDTTGADDEDGVTFPSSPPTGFKIGDDYPVSVNVQNVGAATPLLCGWIDFSDIEQEAGFGFENDSDERVCVPVAASDPLPGSSGCVSAGSGQFNCTLNFVVPSDWNGPPNNANAGGVDSGFLARFRVTTDWATEADSDFNGFASDGEVEDYLIPNTSLPVSIHSFDSRFSRDGLVVEWGTVSETRNIGFQLWGDRGAGMELLTDEMVPSAAVDIAQPQRYSITIPGVFDGDIRDLAITAVDFDGKEDAYGFFEAGRAYGKKVDPSPIAWARIRDEVDARMSYRDSIRSDSAMASAEFAAGRMPRGPGQTIRAVDIRASGVGMHQIRYEDLAAAGLDLKGIPSSEIAVTLKGQPVARDITAPEFSVRSRDSIVPSRSSAGTFGPGSVIRFWAEAPPLPDRLYLDHYSYRIEVDSARAIAATVDTTAPKPGPQTVTALVRENRDLRYEFALPLDDPWFAAMLRANSASSTYATELMLAPALDSSQPGRIEVVVGGFTSYDNVSPDHRVQIEVNGQIVADELFDGQVQKSIAADIPAGLLQPGSNQVRVIAPGGTAAPFDLFAVDSIDIHHASALQAQQDRFMAEAIENTGGLTVTGLTTLDTVAYAWTGRELVRLPRLQFSRGSVRVPTVDVAAADYWVSATREMFAPAAVTGVPEGDLLQGVNADLLVIAHPAFLPVSPDESHPLNDYLADRAAAGWQPAVFDLETIQQQFGHGMRLPGAINAFLAAADGAMAYNHVLLVGGDSYDYRDKLGLGSLSFVPTRYAATRAIKHTPSDNLLADIDGDGVADKALGRWPVRSLADLAVIVDKTLAWDGDPNVLANSAWIADSQDPAQPPFSAQLDLLTGLLADAGWDQNAMQQILLDEVVPPSGQSAVDAARAAYFERLEQGRSLSGFVGHGAPSMWTFQGLLTPDDIGELYNEGAPTLIGTLTCYTSYFVSPYSDTVAHRWMNGYREDASGNPIPGVPNGAVAIHGAATLSSYSENGWFAAEVLDRQLQGMTLGEAIHAVRGISGANGISDQVINWTLLGDPTLRID